MKFPLVRNEKTNYPSKSECAWCKRDKVSEPHSMAVLSGGAILINRKTGDGGPDPRLDGFLCLTWHGAHTNERGQGEYPDMYKTIEIARDVKGGQFDMNFCSTKCLRAFLNYTIDMLEKKIKIKRKRG
jgi:hypothetical protein